MKWFRRDKSFQQDVALFWASEELLTEEEMGHFLQLLQEEKAFYGEERAKVLEYLRFFEGSRPFQNRALRETLNTLLQALRELKVVTAVHFLVFPRNQTGNNLRHCLHPDYFILEMEDISLREHDFFFQAEQQLRQAVSRTSESYRAFRHAALKRLRHPASTASSPEKSSGKP